MILQKRLSQSQLSVLAKLKPNSKDFYAHYTIQCVCSKEDENRFFSEGYGHNILRILKRVLYFDYLHKGKTITVQYYATRFDN